MNGDGERLTGFDGDIAMMEACETSADLIEAVNRVLARAHEVSPAVQQLDGVMPIDCVSDVLWWVQRLKAAAGSPTSDDAMHSCPQLYGALRAAVDEWRRSTRAEKPTRIDYPG